MLKRAFRKLDMQRSFVQVRFKHDHYATITPPARGGVQENGLVSTSIHIFTGLTCSFFAKLI